MEAVLVRRNICGDNHAIIFCIYDSGRLLIQIHTDAEDFYGYEYIGCFDREELLKVVRNHPEIYSFVKEIISHPVLSMFFDVMGF